MPYAIRIHETGGPEKLVWDEISVGDPGPGQARLRQTAVGVNFIDIYYRAGLYELPRPFIPGREAVGVVEAVGPDVTSLKPGDRVVYSGVQGAYAQVRLVPADRLVKLRCSLHHNRMKTQRSNGGWRVHARPRAPYITTLNK
jgi:NADPH2:quinone reductase